MGDDDVLVAYEGDHQTPLRSLVHEIRYRRAPFAGIATAPDQLLVHDIEGHGLPKIWEGIFAFGRRDTGWIGFRADAKLYLFRVGADGLATKIIPRR